MATMAAILKFFKQHLPNLRSDWAKTWWEASEQNRDSELLKLLWWPWRPSWNSSNDISSQTISWVQPKLDVKHRCDIEMATILKFFKPHLLPNSKSGWAETRWEASGWRGDSELLNRSVPISKMVAMVAILKLFKQHRILNC